MPATTPEEICRLFQRYMAEGNIDRVLSLYDSEVAFITESGDIIRGVKALRLELAPFAAAKFDFHIEQVIQSDDIALMHTRWNISTTERRSLYAVEVARRQQDGTWRWLIGDPFTVGRQTADGNLYKRRAIAEGHMIHPFRLTGSGVPFRVVCVVHAFIFIWLHPGADTG